MATACLLLVGIQQAALSEDRSAANPDTSDYYERGADQEAQGHIRQALSIWEEGWKNLEDPQFRLAQRYIAVASREKVEEAYRKASEIYFWGLNDPSISQEREVVLRELQYLEPLVDRAEYQEMQDLAEQGDADVLDEVRLFWNKTDPTPLSEYNERLIEHWHRIAYTEEHYPTREDKDLEDRARIYIRYGDPFYRKQDQLTYNSNMVNSLLSQRMGSMSTMNQFSPTEQVRGDQRFNLESYVRQTHQHPRYEVWIYRDLTDRVQNTIFLFGTQDGGSRFQKINALEDLIPNSAFRLYEPSTGFNSSVQDMRALNDNQQGGQDDEETSGAISLSEYNQGRANTPPPQEITPALLIQIMYYQQLAALDSYFGQTFDQMLTRYNNLNMDLSPSLAREFENTNAGRLMEIERRAPREQSRYARTMPTLPMQLHPYRFRDDSGRPYLKLYLESNPRDAGYYDQLTADTRLNRRSWRQYRLASGVVTLDSLGNVKERDRRNYGLSEGRHEWITSEFNLYPYEEDVTLVAGSQLEKSDEPVDSLFHGDTSFNRAVKAVSNRVVDIPEPLSGENITISDIMVGYTRPDGSQGSSGGEGFVPFSVSHDRAIPEGSNLNLYYEVYELEQPAGGRARFTFSYEMRAKRSGLARLFGSRDLGVNITLNNETDRSSFSQVLEIVTSSFEAGDYKLNIEVTDELTGRSLSRTLDVTIEEG
ncbi:MAG: GWxTD domain-containing protein [Balneolaceae bacterium]|nr:GWxTD domain-containing protein [Balneolaceae bacterium]